MRPERQCRNSNGRLPHGGRPNERPTTPTDTSLFKPKNGLDNGGHFKKERLSDYFLSKYYLSQTLGAQSYQQDQQSEWIKKLLNGQLEQTEAQVRKVTVTNLSTSPYEGLVDFERIVYGNGSDQEIRREDLTATIRFTFADRIDARMMQYNPLGLTIVDFHADQAFH